MEYQENMPKKPATNLGALLIFLLGILVAIEALAVTIATIYFLSLIYSQTVQNLAGAIVIALIAAIFATGLWIFTVATFRSRRWSRGPILTWQVMQFAVATSFIQGFVEWQSAGWVLLALSIATGALMFAPAVTAKFSEKN